MAFLDITVVSFLVVLLVILVAVVTGAANRRGISKDYAEQKVLRRYENGRVIGARFARKGRRWIWEFDVLYEGTIHRVAVDARSSTITEIAIPKGTRSYTVREGGMLGQRIG